MLFEEKKNLVVLAGEIGTLDTAAVGADIDKFTVHDHHAAVRMLPDALLIRITAARNRTAPGVMRDRGIRDGRIG